MKTILITISAGLLLIGCASSEKGNETAEEKPSITEQALERTSSGISGAASAPLKDMNIIREDIPDLLKEIKNPYNIDPAMTCEEIIVRVDALNAVLGRDWDIPPPDKKSMEERAADGASTAVLDTIASQASGVIPYRGIVRTLSGATSHTKKVIKAYERGSHRRTYLKAIGLMNACPHPASPLPEEDVDMIVFK